jgi:hypothetical protein
MRRAAGFPCSDQGIGNSAETTNFDSAFDACQLAFPEFGFVEVDDAERFHMRVEFGFFLFWFFL